MVRIVAVFLLGFTSASCSFLKLDKNTNCLNDQASCFKADTTPPEYRLSNPIANATVSRLQILTVVFSEELKDPKPADVEITGGGRGQLAISSITKTAANTYTFSFSPDVVANGSILLDFSKFQDYNGNRLNYTLALTGNVDIDIEFDLTPGTNPGYRKGVSNGGGYTETVIRWRHLYEDHPGNNWDMRVTTGAVDCAAGTSFFTGTGLVDHTYVQQTFDRLTHFTSGAGTYRIVVCVTNETMNKKGVNSVEIKRDDTPPTVTHLPVSDDYNSTKSMTIACTDNMDKIAISEAQLSPWDGNVANPANPLDPDFGPSGDVSVGTPLAAAHPITNPNNPSRTKVRYRCIDIAGNKSAIGMATYLIDTTLPEVTVNLDSNFRQYVSMTGYTTTTLNFTTNQSETQYRIVKNATSCAALDGTSIIGAGPFTTPPAAPHVINASALDAGVNDIRVCVANVGALKWGTASLQITRDDAVPTVTPSVTTGTYGTVQTVNLTCTPNPDKVAIRSTFQAGSVAPTAPPDPNIDASGNLAQDDVLASQFTTPDMSVSILKWQCITKSGNRSVVDGSTIATYTVDSILPNVTIVSNTRDYVSNLAGAYNFTDLTFQVSRPNLNYSIKSGSTNCVGGTTLVTGTVAAGGQDIIARLNTPFAGPPNHFSAVGNFDLKICVPNFIGALGYSTTSKVIVRDDSRPNNVTGLAITSSGVDSFTLSWPAVTDVGPAGVGLYRIYQSTLQGDYSAATIYTSTTNSVNVTGLNTATTYYFVVRALDHAGNLSVADSNEVKSRTALSVTVSGYASAINGPFRVQLGSGEILSFTANATPQSFANIFSNGDSYSLSIVAQPATQNCAFVANQYGTITGDLLLQVNCVSGYVSGGSLIANKPAPLNYLLYRGNAQIIAGGGAGTSCGSTCNDGTGTNARFSNPHGMAMVSGSLFVADRDNNRIRRIDTTVAPASTTTFAGSGSAATSDGTGTGASFNSPQAITTDGVNLYVVESPPVDQGYLRKVHIATGQVTTLAGGGTQPGGSNCPVTLQGSCKDGRGAQVAFGGANGIVYHDGYLYITEYTNNRVRRMNLATGVVDTIAGDGQPQSATNTTGTNAQFNGATGAAVAGGVLYVADFNGHRIRAVSLTAPFAVTAVAGTGDAGHADGPLATARFYNPDHLTTDGYNLFVTEYSGDGNTGRRLRRIDLRKGRVSTIAGNSVAVDTSGTGIAASFYSPVGIASDGRQLFVGTYDGGRIFRVTDSGLVGYWAIDPGVNPNDYNSDNTSVNNGSVANAPLGTSADRYGSSNLASILNGTNQYVSSTGVGLPAGPSVRTLCAWFKPNAIPSAFQTIAAYGTASGNGSFGITLVGDGVSTTLKLHLNGGANDVDASYVPIEAGKWSHACAVYDGSRVRLHFDGKVLASEAKTPATTGGTSLQIGRYVNGAMFFAGAISDVRVYNRALNEGEINELAQDAAENPAITGVSFNTGPTGLVSHYQFNSGLDDQPAAPIGGSLTFSGTKTVVAGKDGDAAGALFYDGVSHNAGSGLGLPLGAAPRSVCSWVRLAAQPAGSIRFPIVSYGTVGTYFDLVYFNAGTTATPDYRLALSDTGSSIEAGFVMPLNTWQHTCITHDGTATRIFANGQQILGTADTLASITSVTILNIGKRTVSTARFHGAIDDVRIYNNALSAAQVRQLATQVPAGLVFRMDTVGDASDMSGLNQALASNTGVLTAGRHGVANTAYRFTSGELATYAHSSTLNAPNMTWSFWMKSPSMTGGDLNTSIIRKFQTFNADGWVVKYDHINYLHNYKASGTIQSAHESLVNNIWTHYTVVRSANGATDNIYINGQSSVNSGGVGAIIGNTAQMLIGANGTGDMTLQDVRIYNRVLDQAEVRALSGYHPDHGVSGMVLHVQADNYANLTDGALISTNWQDSTIRDRYTLTGGVPSGSPRFVSGASSLLGKKPAIEFDGVDGKYFEFGNTAVTYSGLTVCSALTRKGLGFRGLVEKRGGFQTNSWGMITENAANAMKFEIGDPPGANVVDTVTDDTPSIYCMVNGAGNAIQTFVNGQLSSTVVGSTLTGANNQPLLVGARYNYASSYHGQIGEVIVAAKDASTAERRISECYLAAKYSIPLVSGIVCP
jgi:hypothetical protein